ncbi:MAG: hypothetical protein DBX55_05245 [Verrucomicrobia bacterium]|nr:MAG: hypothetical protein DBX55_05245 [Verrucomicrobiota bacterium]
MGEASFGRASGHASESGGSASFSARRLGWVRRPFFLPFCVEIFGRAFYDAFFIKCKTASETGFVPDGDRKEAQ